MNTVTNGSVAPSIEDVSQRMNPTTLSQVGDLISQFFAGWSNWQIAVTILLTLVAYDQCKF
jgi:hypothetical protein